MSVLKNLERGIGRSVLWLLKHTVRRRRPLPKDIDFNRCKFLFVRNDRIGDVLVSTPLISLIHKHYPAATLDFFLSRKNHFVLDNDPRVRKRWIYTKGVLDSLRLLSDIHREQYDFVVDLWDAESVTSSAVCALSGARWTVGLAKENDFIYDIAVPRLSRKDTHIVDRLLMIATAFGLEGRHGNARVEYMTAGASRTKVDQFLSSSQIGSTFLLGINISAGSEARYWGTENFQTLAAAICAHYPDARILLLCKPTEWDRAKEIAAQDTSIVVAPATHSFDEFAAFIERLSVLITPDTSAVHLAAAFGIPSVVLYVQTTPDLGIWTPYGTLCEPVVTIAEDLSGISPEMVFTAVRRLIACIPASSLGAGERSERCQEF